MFDTTALATITELSYNGMHTTPQEEQDQSEGAGIWLRPVVPPEVDTFLSIQTSQQLSRLSP
jgi:hypothetical protein